MLPRSINGRDATTVRKGKEMKEQRAYQTRDTRLTDCTKLDIKQGRHTSVKKHVLETHYS